MKRGIDKVFDVQSLKTFCTNAPFVDVFAGRLHTQSRQSLAV
jgi:hypothetical protein